MARSACDDCEADGPVCRRDTVRPYRRPFLIGVYLATNAIPDAVTIVDGPDCAFFKAEFIHGKHDLRSTLLDVTGRHRIVPTQVTTDDLATSQGQQAAALVRRAAVQPDTGLVLLTAMPLVTITGVSHDGIARELRPELPVDLVTVPARSLQGDWLAGYGDTLTALAHQLVADEAVRDGAEDRRSASQPSVSIIGYFMDRNEEDHRANVAELRRLVAGLGLPVDAVWLSGQGWSELRRARRSTTLVAFPLGRAAAAVIAAATGARVVEIDPPLGLAATERFLRALGAATSTESRAAAFVDAELARLVPRLEWLVPHRFLGKRVAFFGLPELLAGFHELATDLGMEVTTVSCPAERPAWLDEGVVAALAVTFDVPPEVTARGWWQHGAPRPDLVIGDTDALERVPPETPCVELGFPGYSDHALFERPFLGFRGALAFIQRMATALGTTTGRMGRR